MLLKNPFLRFNSIDVLIVTLPFVQMKTATGEEFSGSRGVSKPPSDSRYDLQAEALLYTPQPPRP